MKSFVFLLLLFAAPPLSAISVKDAYIKESIPSGRIVWRIGNSKIQLELTYKTDQLLLTGLFNPETSTQWTPPLSQASLAQLMVLRFRNREYRFQVPDGEGGFQLKAHGITSDQKSVKLELVFTRAGLLPQFEVLLYYRIFPGSFVENWTEIRSINPVTGPRLEVLRVGRAHLPVGSNDGQWEVADTQASRYGEPLRIDWLSLRQGGLLELPLHGSSLVSGTGYHSVLLAQERYIGVFDWRDLLWPSVSSWLWSARARPISSQPGWNIDPYRSAGCL